jgi:hypothetical protein
MFPPKTLKRTPEEDTERLVFDKFISAIRSPEGAALSGVLLAQQEEHVLRCLGAALIMQWDTIPANLRRELFDNAGAMGELIDTQDLRGKVAIFLRKHSDENKRSSASMRKIFETGSQTSQDPELIIRKALHAPVWSVWAVLEGTPSEEIFEGPSQDAAINWIENSGTPWIAARRQKRTA